MKLKWAMIFAEVLLLLFWSGSSSSALENSSVLCANKIYNTELTLKDAHWIAARSDLLIISGVGDEYVEQMKAENPDIKIFRYFTVCLISSGSYPSYNVTGYEYVKENHPDWFITDSAGKEVHPSAQLYGMDPAAQGWAEYWLKRVLEVVSPLPYDGVHGDLAYIDIGNIIPEAKHEYPREQDFHRVQERYLATLHRRLNREGKLLILNNATMASRTDPDYLLNRRIHNCDGFNQQAFVMRWRNHPENRFVNAERLAARGMEIIDECARRKKIVMLGMQPSPDRREIAYCVGCYLLMKNDPWVYLNIDWAGKYKQMRRLFREYGDIINADYGV
ncbi:MAG: putative glycoside hydrolase, partial [Candidatus Zixiibacteriota bacterium]